MGLRTFGGIYGLVGRGELYVMVHIMMIMMMMIHST